MNGTDHPWYSNNAAIGYETPEDMVLNALEWLESYLRDTPHHNAPAAANARGVIAKIRDGGTGNANSPWGQLCRFGCELPSYFRLSCDPRKVGDGQIWTLSYSNGGFGISGQGYTLKQAIDAAHTLSCGGECPFSPDGFHHMDTSMEEGPHHCFNCGANMKDAKAQIDAFIEETGE
jgi:hypothetical protein